MKLNGYRASHRNKWFLVTEGILSIQEFVLFEYFLDLMDFDKTHKEKFASFEVFLDEIALLFNKKIDSVRNWHKGLVDKGFVQAVDPRRKLYTVSSPLRYVAGNKWGGEASRFAKEEKDQPNEFILENIRFFQPKDENIQQESDKVALKLSIPVPNPLTSSKNESSRSIALPSVGSKKVVVIRQEVRSDAEYQKIYTDGNFKGLLPDEMKFVDQTLFEEIIIENDEQEKEIVRIYFDGDWDKYRKKLKKSGGFLTT